MGNIIEKYAYLKVIDPWHKICDTNLYYISLSGIVMSKYLKLFFIPIVCLFFYCSTIDSPLSSTDEYGKSLDYKIYSVVINRMSSHELSSMIVLSDSTVHYDISEIYDNIKNKIDSIDDETLTDYQNINQKPVKLLNIPDLKIQCMLIPKNNEGNWKKIYPDASGLYHLSRVGYNSKETQALVYVSAYSAPLVATGSLFYLVKEENWIIKRSIMVWIS